VGGGAISSSGGWSYEVTLEYLNAQNPESAWPGAAADSGPRGPRKKESLAVISPVSVS
jgi:hypothetical protein